MGGNARWAFDGVHSQLFKEEGMELQPELVSVKTLSKLIDTPEGTIRDWILKARKGEAECPIPYYKMPNGDIRFHMDDVRGWYRPCKVTFDKDRIPA